MALEDPSVVAGPVSTVDKEAKSERVENQLQRHNRSVEQSNTENGVSIATNGSSLVRGGDEDELTGAPEVAIELHNEDNADPGGVLATMDYVKSLEKRINTLAKEVERLLTVEKKLKEVTPIAESKEPKDLNERDEPDDKPDKDNKAVEA